MTVPGAEAAAVADEAAHPADLIARLRELSRRPPLMVRYVLVSGAFGVPASIGQLALMLLVYRSVLGDYGFLALNAMWIANFELGLMRNYLLHCAYTWGMRPTWGRTRDAHVAAIGAFLVDIVVFNSIVFATGIVPLAQLVGAGSGFGFNFTFNRFKTFARAPGEADG